MSRAPREAFGLKVVENCWWHVTASPPPSGPGVRVQLGNQRHEMFLAEEPDGGNLPGRIRGSSELGATRPIGEQPAEVTLTERHDVVGALAADAADQADHLLTGRRVGAGGRRG